MTSPEIRRLQYLNDLITQTLEFIQQRSMGAGVYGFNPLSLGNPYAAQYANPYAQWSGASYATPYPQLQTVPFGGAFGPQFGTHLGSPFNHAGFHPFFGQVGTHLPYGQNGIPQGLGVPFSLQTPVDRSGLNPVAVS